MMEKLDINYPVLYNIVTTKFLETINEPLTFGEFAQTTNCKSQSVLILPWSPILNQSSTNEHFSWNFLSNQLTATEVSREM